MTLAAMISSAPNASVTRAAIGEIDMTGDSIVVVCQGLGGGERGCGRTFRVSDNLGNFDREPAGVCCYHCRKWFCKTCAEMHFGTFVEQPMAQCRLEAIEWLQQQDSPHAKVALAILENSYVRSAR
jgi:hypothetical protein